MLEKCIEHFSKDLFKVLSGCIIFLIKYGVDEQNVYYKTTWSHA